MQADHPVVRVRRRPRGPPPIQDSGGGGGVAIASGRCSDLPQTEAAVTHLLQALAFDIGFLTLTRSLLLAYYNKQGKYLSFAAASQRPGLPMTPPQPKGGKNTQLFPADALDFLHFILLQNIYIYIRFLQIKLMVLFELLFIFIPAGSWWTLGPLSYNLNS